MSDTQAVKSCARCGGDHEAVEFKRFVRPIMPDTQNWGWEKWGTCPTTGDPIIQSESWAKAMPAPGHWEWKYDEEKP